MLNQQFGENSDLPCGVLSGRPEARRIASVNPIFTWVRLAQRVPVRIHIDQVPDGVRLVAGMTATVQIDPQPVGHHH
jgi:multidrug resistance efflux pump